MAMTHTFETIEPARAEIDRLSGPVVLEFGAPWCSYCQAAQGLLQTAFDSHPAVRHIKVEDGKGKPLGRSFKVKLWPTLIFLDNGQETARLVRPADAEGIGEALTRIDSASLTGR
ncbi:MAG: thioredoxin family protein [Herbaspirillum sp.]|nr:thioredoxin family protein [Herbaspirillum sp.]